MILVWMRRDLRLEDNPALYHALRDAQNSGEVVEAVYCHCDELYGNWPLGGASQWYLQRSLSSLATAMQQIGVKLQFFSAESVVQLADYARQKNVSSVYWNRVVEPTYEACDEKLLKALAASSINGERFDDDCLLMPEQVHKDDGSPYKVFTPFWRRAQFIFEQEPSYDQRLMPLTDLSTGATATKPESAFLDELLPGGNWFHKLADVWQPGESQAQIMLQQFLANPIEQYESGRDLPASRGTSRLSAGLHFGELSVVRVFHECSQLLQQETDSNVVESIKRFMSELGWREFGRHVLSHFPYTSERSLNRSFDNPSMWESDQHEDHLQAWQRGETGIPLVDAGMRELWNTGWMHNRVRMVVGSFLTKNLGIHWSHGARWFWDTLVDADLASNTMGWQWVSGCGTDAAPYFRIFNPHTQAKKFDPQANYITRWLSSDHLIPELIDLKMSREKALARYKLTMDEARSGAGQTA